MCDTNKVLDPDYYSKNIFINEKKINIIKNYLVSDTGITEYTPIVDNKALIATPDCTCIGIKHIIYLHTDSTNDINAIFYY